MALHFCIPCISNMKYLKNKNKDWTSQHYPITITILIKQNYILYFYLEMDKGMSINYVVSREVGMGGGQKIPILRRHSLWMVPKGPIQKQCFQAAKSHWQPHYCKAKSLSLSCLVFCPISNFKLARNLSGGHQTVVRR